MKKKSLVISGFILFVISVLFIITNCSKEKEQPTANKNNTEVFDVKLVNGIITFADTSVYIKVLTELNELNNEKLAEWETTYPGFSSFNKYCIQNGLDTTMKDYDAAFFTVLNENKELIIGNYYFKLNFENRTLIAKPKESNSLKSVMAGTEEMEFSFEDDVFDRLSQNGLQLKSISAASLCPDQDTYWVLMNKLANGHARYRLSYVSLGVYFKLYATIEEVDGDCIVKVISHAGGDCKYLPKDKYCVTVVSDMIDSDGHDATIIPYGPSMRGLDAYTFTAHFGAKSGPYWNDYYEETITRECTLGNCH